MADIELKLVVRDDGRRTGPLMLEVDPLEAEIRQVYFFDTPGLALHQNGLMLCARTGGDGGDSMVKLRSPALDALPPSADRGVEMDTTLGGCLRSGAIKEALPGDRVRAVVLGERPVHSLLSGGQRDFFTDHAPPDVVLDDLAALGPVAVLQTSMRPAGSRRELALELWNYPQYPHLLEVSTRITPAEMAVAAAETSRFLREKGLTVGDTAMPVAD
ncbi:hypothetical protein HII36_34205 [Nonomuraea sp. NN258]|uniref:hypothetical protein n=1 Tax=Nonomuraea antri TaxID=2730852 RepID=UPI0015688268|nr:hypothetical protein [Nonomuraea antri]NRQ36856.1 hypothetical protein [Nonomuraea antri]